VADQAGLRPCATCGSPTTAERCAFCRLVERAGGTPPEHTLVELGETRRRGEVPT
jgi:hypothetical protein